MRSVLTAAATFALSLAVSAQPPGLVDARAAISAAIAAQDKAAYARFLSDDITSIDSAGRLRDKATAVEDMPASSTQAHADITAHGTGAVVEVATQGASPARIIQVWVKTGDQWQMVASQGARKDGVVAATQTSSPLPASSGARSDRDSIERMFGAATATERLTVRQMSTRIYGTLAIANMRLHAVDNVEFWRTSVLVNESGRWKQAAEITTPITGAARSTSR